MTMFKALGLGLVLAMVSAPLVAQPPAEKPATAKPAAEKPAAEKPAKPAAPVSALSKAAAADLAAIRQASVEFENAFNSGSAKSVAALWTEDGDFISESGETFAGREAIEKAYTTFFDANKGAKLKTVIDSLRLLSDSAAIEDGRAILDPSPAGAPSMTKYTVVHVKSGGKWLMSTVRDTRIEIPSAYQKVEDLEWLIGTWQAEEHGAKTESVCRWIANKSFVQRTYTVKHPDQTTTSGVQIIGFNPQGNHVQSWSFSSDGSYAVGIWAARENGWAAEVHGTRGDGQTTRAVNLITKLDDNAYSWQSVERTVGGQAIPDTEEVILKRQAK